MRRRRHRLWRGQGVCGKRGDFSPIRTKRCEGSSASSRRARLLDGRRERQIQRESTFNAERLHRTASAARDRFRSRRAGGVHGCWCLDHAANTHALPCSSSCRPPHHHNTLLKRLRCRLGCTCSPQLDTARRLTIKASTCPSRNGSHYLPTPGRPRPAPTTRAGPVPPGSSN